MMRKALLIPTAFIFTALLFCGAAWAHGGQYVPPGDSVPPNLGPPGGPTNGNGPPGAVTPGPTGPAAPGIRGPATPTLPTGPSSRKRGGAFTKKSRGGGSLLGAERWEYWWRYNKEPYLDIKNRLDGARVYTGNAGFLIGKGRKSMALPSRRVSADMIRKQVIPTLLAALDETDADILDSAVLAVARTTRADDAQTVYERIRGLLSSRHRTVRQSACLALGVLGSPMACRDCYDLMVDSRAGRSLVGGGEVPRMTRAFAALSLGLIGSDPMARKLRLVIEKEDSRTRKDLIACAVTALGFMDGENVRDENVRFLIGLLGNSRLDPTLEACIPTALGQLGDPAALPAIIEKFNDRATHFSVRQSCAIALGRLATIDQGDVIAILRRRIDRDKDALTRHLCFIALAQIGAGDDDHDAHESTHREIARFFLKKVVKPDRQQHRAWAALAGAIHAREHEVYKGPLAGRLREAFADASNPSDRSALAVSLGLLQATGSVEMLMSELEDTKNKALKGYICVALGLMNWKQAAETIRDIVENETVFTLRFQAARALGMMGDTEAVAVLIEVLKNSNTLTVTASAAKALGLIGDSRAVAPLQAVLTDTKAGGLSRAFAAVALGILGEKTDLPWNTAISTNCNYAAMVPAIGEVLDIF